MSLAKPPPARLGIYVDAVYELVENGDGLRVATPASDFGFLLFACEVGGRFDRLLLFGRAASPGSLGDTALLPAGVELVPLPFYPDLRHLLQVTRAVFGTVRSFHRGLARVDTVWVFGPHPFSFLLVALAFVRRKRIVLGVRQDTVPYYRGRLPNRRWAPALLGVRAMDLLYRLLARGVRATVVGTAVAGRYGAERPSVLAMTVSLVRAQDVAASPPARDWAGTIDLLTVSRLEPEKNPLLLIEALSELERERPGRYRLTWAGSGWLDDEVRARAAELGVEELVDLRGYVAFGPELLHLYRRAHLFVHVSLTEGVPQVLVEALACGTPIVATDVGGVAAALDGGAAGLLVPPGNRGALVSAIGRITDEPALRDGLVSRGLELARTVTLERESERVARFIAADKARSG